MRQPTIQELLMARIYSLGKKQHYVQMGDFKSAYEVVGESQNG